MNEQNKQNTQTPPPIPSQFFIPPENEKAMQKSKMHVKGRKQLGLFDPSTVSQWFDYLIYGTTFVLFVLSCVGTVFSLGLNTALPIDNVTQAVEMMVSKGYQTIGSIVLQVLLSIIQFGSKVKTAEDKRWWFLYLLSYGLSVYFNVDVYFPILVDVFNVPLLIAFLLIATSDAVVELVAVKAVQK